MQAGAVTVNVLDTVVLKTAVGRQRHVEMLVGRGGHHAPATVGVGLDAPSAGPGNI